MTSVRGRIYWQGQNKALSFTLQEKKQCHTRKHMISCLVHGLWIPGILQTFCRGGCFSSRVKTNCLDFFFNFWTRCSLKLPKRKINISKNKLLPALWNSKKAFKIDTQDVASDRQLVSLFFISACMSLIQSMYFLYLFTRYMTPG